MKRAAVLGLLASLALAAGCGESAGPAPDPAMRPLAGFGVAGLSARSRVLDRETLAADSFHPEELGDLLSDAGYATGRERELSGKTKTFDHVVLRSLAFGGADGADAYLGWLREHPQEVLGQSADAGIAAPGDAGLVLRLVPCGSCKKELPTFFAAWRRDAMVGTLLAAGSGADEMRFRKLLVQADETIR